MGSKYQGACLCGGIRYATDEEPVFSGNCHCTDCQRTSGGAYTPAMLFPAANLQITGTPKYYKSAAESGNSISRGFCPECGSQLFSILEFMPDMIGIKAGTLDDPSMYKPQMDIWAGSAQHWDTLNDTLPKFPKSPRQ